MPQRQHMLGADVHQCLPRAAGFSEPCEKMVQRKYLFVLVHVSEFENGIINYAIFEMRSECFDDYANIISPAN